MPAKYELCPLTGVKYRIRTESDWSQLSDPVLSFEVSVNNRFCYGDYFVCQLELVRQSFRRFTVSLGDLLNIHTYSVLGHPIWGSVTMTEARDIADQEGIEWIRLHEGFLEQLLPQGSYEIFRWARWMSDSKFESHRQMYQNLYRTNEVLKAAVNADALSFARRKNMVENLELADLDELSLHVIEELAVYQIQVDHAHTVIQYPASMSHTYRLLKNPDGPLTDLKDLNYRYLELRGREISD